MNLTPNHRRRQRGVTREEVVAVLLVLAVLGVFLAGWISIAAGRGKEAQCAANVRRLLQAFHTYSALHTNLPAAASADRMRPEDWLHWQPGRRIGESALAGPLGELSYRNLTCPKDQETRYRQFQFSYTMNARGHLAAPRQLGSPAQVILVAEEEHPNDGAWSPGQPGEGLARRHAHFTSQAGFWDGSVRLVPEAEATQSPPH